MAKKVISAALAVALTCVFCGILGINIRSSIAVIGMAVAFTLLANWIIEDVTDGTKVTVPGWITYGSTFLATIFWGLGMQLNNVYLLIVMGVFAVVAVACYLVEKKKLSKTASATKKD